MSQIDGICVSPGNSLRETMQCIDRNGQGIAVVVDEDRRLLYTITDGDLRRAILRGIDLEVLVETWAAERCDPGARQPVTLPASTPRSEILERMRAEALRHIPLVDDVGRVVELALLSDLAASSDLGVEAVVMAGGFGTRLRPLTNDLPKPMLPLGAKPILECVINQLQSAGVRRVSVSTHYRSDVIVEHFGNGRNFGLEIDYVSEEVPLGTAGALGLLGSPAGTTLVVNGDVLTKLDFRSLVAYHRDNSAEFTVGVRQYEIRVPYGVIETEGVQVTTVSEKPLLRFFVNAGVYCLEPSAFREIPSGERFDMTDLINALVARGRRVVSFPIHEYWIDVGQQADYENAVKDAANGRF